MPVICLYQKSEGFYLQGCFTVYVSEDIYKLCSLFKCFKHTPYRSKKGCIFIYKSRNSNDYLAISNPCLCLECVHVYYNQHDPARRPLVLVFQFQKPDENGGNGFTNRYYRMSCFDTDKCEGKRIEDLCTYTDEQSILCPLLQENDKLDKVLTYDIMKRPTGAGEGNGTNCTYNCNKISVTNDTSTNANGNGEPKVGAGFTRFKHTPTNSNGNNNNGNNAGKQACVIYRCQVLVGDGTTGGTQAQAQELPHIQNQKYAHIRVYFGCRAKRPPPGKDGTSDCKPGEGTCPPGENSAASATCTPATGQDTCPAPEPATTSHDCSQDVPLLLELLKNGTNSDTGANQPEYYAHLRSTNGAQETGGNNEGQYYWVQLPCGNGADGRTNGDCVLKNLLEDIGLHTKKQNGASHNGHETLKQLLKSALNNGDGSDAQNGQDLTDKLKQLKGDKLRKLLGQSVNGPSSSQNGSKTLATLLLRRVEFNVTDSLVILLDKKCKNGGHNGGQNGSYGDSDIQSAVSNLQPSGKDKRINRLKLGNGACGVNGKQIKVTQAPTDNGDTSTVCQCLAKCLKKYGYCVIQHDFSQAVNSKLGQGCSAGLRLLIPAMGNGGVGTNGQNNTKYRELKLYPGDKQTDPAHLQYLYFAKGAGSEGSAACTTACTTSTTGHTCSKTQDAQTCSRLYVVFYKGVDGTNTGGSTGDPRPLLLCYRGCWYRPKDKDGYFSAWVKVGGVSDESAGTCACDTQEPPTCPKHEKLLCELTKVVGFLNQVNLFQHPKGTGEEGQGTQCQPGEPGAAGAGTPTQCQPASTSGQTTCQSETSSAPTGNTCTYTVHTYTGKQVKVQVECQDVPNTQTPASTAQTCTQTPGSGCYRKLTHKPAGLGNGADGSSSSSENTGFRLGNVVYCPSSSSGDQPQGTIKYYGNGSDSVGNGNISADHKWSPLLQVTAYFYNHDTGYCDPLLVELEFAKPGNGLQNGANDDKEYYRLKTRNGSGGKLVWAKVDNGSKTNLAKPECLTRYLDQIRYCLKKVVRIQLQCKGTNGGQGYALEGRDAKPGSGGSNGFQPIKNGDPPSNGEVKVTVCECQCPKLTQYKCYQHKLCEALSTKHHLVAGLAFTLPGKNGVGANGGTNGVVEIPLYSAAGSEEQGLGSSCPAVPGQPSVPGAPGTCPPAPEPVKPGQPITTLYNSCMGDVYVYFYAGTNGAVQPATVDTDTVPLMLRYNGQFYRPCDRDNYFTRWVCVPALAATKGECRCACCCGASGDGCTPGGPSGPGADCGPDCPCCSKLAEQLDRVNECLNRVDLDPEKATKAGSGGSSTGYGLPEQSNAKGTKVDTDTFKTDRVTLVKQEGPKQPPGSAGTTNAVYERVVHRTKNGFWIGQLMYCCKDITNEGVNLGLLKNGQCDGPALSNGQTCSASSAPVNGQGTTIRVAKGTGGPNGHKNLVTTCGWNTVVVYYSTSDKCYRLPQLIVILHTDKVDNGGTVTGSANKKYGYYVLSSASTGGGGVGASTGYAYQWRLVNGSKTPVKLDDKTDFQLLNAAVILLERRKGKNGGQGGTYGDDKIKNAVTKAGLTSPGNSDGVNRLTGKEITVSEEPGEGTSGETHQCYKKYGFKVMTHDLTPFVKLNGSFKPPLCQINLIAGLKLLIPTGERGKYKQVQLNGDATKDGAQNGSVKYHHPDNGDKICVYFYCSDPRPLLVCYNGWAYAAKNKKCYFSEWHRVQGLDVTNCGCPCQRQPQPAPGECSLLKELVGVSDFLNPVNINMIPKCSRPCKYYGVHWFNGRRVWITVLAQFACGSFCYNKYTHTHYGIYSDGSGFRLGNIHYNNKGKGSEQGGDSTCIKENGASDSVVNGNGCISASHDKNGGLKCGAFPVVVVFYYKLDTGHKSPIVVAMCSGDCDNLTCELYYVLKDRGEKTYTKRSESLDMNNEEELGKQLDKALFNNSKKLQIVLSTRPVPTEYKTGQNGLITDVFDTGTGDKSSNQKAAKQLFDVKTRILNEVAKEADELEKTSKTTATNALTADKPLATRDSLMHHVTLKTTYDAHLCDNKGQPSAPPEPNATEIPVEEVHCPGLQPGGYRCFKHALTTASGISEVGGLVLRVFAGQKGGGPGAKSANGKCQPCPKQGEGQGNEGLELCTGQTTSNGETGCKNGKNGCKTGKNGQSVQLSYTTCKGNLYVFFYRYYGSKVTLKRVVQDNFV